MNKLMRAIKPVIIKYEPEILMGVGIGGLVFSGILGIQVTFKAAKIMEELKKELKKDKLTFKETFNALWSLYLPVVIGAGLSIPSIILGNRVSAKRNAVIAAAYAISETAFQDYKQQTKNVVGEKKEQEIQEKVCAKKINDTYGKSEIILTGDGECLFFEKLSGRYFKSSWNKIAKAANELNADTISSLCGTTTLTDWYYELGLEPTATSDDIGWSIENGTDGLIKVSVSSTLTPDNIPCGSINYDTLPKPLKNY